MLFLNQSVYVPFAETVCERLYDLLDEEMVDQELGVAVVVLPLSTLYLLILYALLLAVALMVASLFVQLVAAVTAGVEILKSAYLLTWKLTLPQP